MITDPATSHTQWLFGGGFATIGAGVAWLWGQISTRSDKRLKALEEKERSLDARESEHMAALEKSIAALEDKVATLETKVGELQSQLQAAQTANVLLINRVSIDLPNAPELDQVRAILGAAYPLPGILQVPMGRLNQTED